MNRLTTRDFVCGILYGLNVRGAIELNVESPYFYIAMSKTYDELDDSVKPRGIRFNDFDKNYIDSNLEISDIGIYSEFARMIDNNMLDISQAKWKAEELGFLEDILSHDECIKLSKTAAEVMMFD